jgi:hypothetical protein
LPPITLFPKHSKKLAHIECRHVERCFVITGFRQCGAWRISGGTYSNQIEGNQLGETEVTAVLQGKRVAGSQKDIKEVQNYHEALDLLTAA